MGKPDERELGGLIDLIIERRKIHVYDPWQDLARRKGVDITWHTNRKVDRFDAALGFTRFDQLRVSLLVDQNTCGGQLKATLAHELGHLDRGPTGFTGLSEAREERAVDLLAAWRQVDPVIFDELMAATNGCPTRRQVNYALAVRGSVFDTYEAWRRRVKPTTAVARWEECKEPAPWPAPWIERCEQRWPLAAAFSQQDDDAQ